MRVPFVLPPGLVSDDTTFASGGAWEDGSNVRFWRGQPQVIGGWSALTTDTVTGKCRSLLAWTDNTGDLNIGFGTHSHLMVYAGGDLFDITPSGLAAGGEDGLGGPGYGGGAYDTGTYGTIRTEWFPRTWALSNYGQTLIASPREGTIYQWSNDTAVAAVAITNAPAKCTYVLVTPERQILAFGCNEESSGTFNPLCIRGCDIENPTVWMTASNNNAFEHILEGGGKIVAARQFGPYVAVWTDNGVHLGQFIGEPGQAYRFDRVEENCGLIGPNAVAIFGQTAYWIGPDHQFRSWTIGGPPQIITCPIRSDFKDNLAAAQQSKIVASSIAQFGEIWWFYPDSRDGDENSRYIAVSTFDGTWFRGQMARTTFADSGVAGYPLGVTDSGDIFYHEYGNNANGGNLQWHLKSADQYIDKAQRAVMVRGIWPDFESQAGAISLTIEARRYPQDTSVTTGTYSLTAGVSKKDFRISGRVFSVKWSGASNPSFMRGGKSSFDIEFTGER